MWPHHEEEQRRLIGPLYPKSSFRVLIWGLGWNKEQEIHMAKHLCQGVVLHSIIVWGCSLSCKVTWQAVRSMWNLLAENMLPFQQATESQTFPSLSASFLGNSNSNHCTLRQWYNSSRDGCECLFSISSLLPGLLHLSTLCLHTSFLRWDMHLSKAQS